MNSITRATGVPAHCSMPAMKSTRQTLPRAVTGITITQAMMIQNLWWATGYNAFAIPAAAGVFYSLGVVLSPAVGAVFMSLSTVIVAINARFLRVERQEEGSTTAGSPGPSGSHSKGA